MFSSLFFLESMPECIDWEAVFKPDLIDDCDGFEKDYFKEDLWDDEENLWVAKEDLSDGEEDLCYGKGKEIEFRRKNRLFTILLETNTVENIK